MCIFLLLIQTCQGIPRFQLLPLVRGSLEIPVVLEIQVLPAVLYSAQRNQEVQADPDDQADLENPYHLKPDNQIRKRVSSNKIVAQFCTTKFGRIKNFLVT